MQGKIKQYLLGRIIREWRSLPDRSRPWGVWVRYYAPLATDVWHIGVDSPVPLQAWFLDRNGLGERSVWEYQRFHVVHCKQPWCGRILAERSLPVSTGSHEIWQAAFAQYEDNSGVYLDLIWGGLWGYGRRVSFDASGEPVDDEAIWVS